MEGTALVDTMLTHPNEVASEVVWLSSEHEAGVERYRQPTLERINMPLAR